MSNVRVTSPAELVAAVPALLGFHPTESLVGLWTNEKTQLVCSIRFDLAMPEPMMARTLLDLIRRQEPDGRLTLVVYPPDRALPTAVEDLMDRFTRLEVPLLDVLLVADDRWWSMLCADPTCCPPEGTALLTSISPVEVSRVTDGAPAVADSRDEAEARYRLRPDEQPTQLQLRHGAALVTGDIWKRAAVAIDVLVQLSSTSIDVPADQAAVMHLLQDVQVRDITLATIIDRKDRESLVAALIDVALRTPTELRPRIAGAASAASAALGDSSVRTWAMVDLAEDDSLADLVAQAMVSMVNPRELRRIFSDAVEMMREAESVAAQRFS